MKRPRTEMEHTNAKHLVSVAWTEIDTWDINGPWTEDKRIILKHLVWGAWTEEE